MRACLDVRNLSVRYESNAPAVNDVSFRVNEGECLGVVGESGSGKTQVFMAVMGLLTQRARIEGAATFKDLDLLRLDARALNRLRGSQIAMVFQDPMTALTPHLTIGSQLREVLSTHAPDLSAAEATRRALAMLGRVRVPQGERRLRQYPHELSGGMRQRVLIAMACLCRPQLLIADEPTTALDVTVQAQVLSLLQSLRRETGTAVALITHDLAMLAGIADRVIVMYSGRIVESADAAELFERPLHPYSNGLLQCLPSRSGQRLSRLPSIPGLPPDPAQEAAGCAFAPRCPRARPVCVEQRPSLALRTGGREVACHFPHEVGA
jgi:oligopeptide transport system ATP-binding protein